MPQNIYRLKLPAFITLWLMFSTIIVLWDVLFVLLRPASLPGGNLATFWLPYAKYIQIETSYAEPHNYFVIAQAIMSLIEIGIGLCALMLNYWHQSLISLLLAYSALLLTGSKTVLLFLLEAVSGFIHIRHNTAFDLIVFYILPNALWIIMPGFGITILGRYLTLGRLRSGA